MCLCFQIRPVPCDVMLLITSMFVVRSVEILIMIRFYNQLIKGKSQKIVSVILHLQIELKM